MQVEFNYMRKIFYLLIIGTIIFNCKQNKAPSTAQQSKLDTDAAFITAESLRLVNDTTRIKRFVIIVAPRIFNDDEFKTTYQLLTRVGHKVKVASRDTVVAIGSSGTMIKPHMTINDIDTLNFNGIILIGGTGSAIYWDDKTVHQLVQYYARTSPNIVAAICLAPITLVRAGILTGLKATVFEDKTTINEMKNKNVLYEKTDVVVSKNIITASGPQAKEKFAKKIIQLVSRN